MSQLNNLQLTIIGKRPLVMHNGQLADPLNPYAQELAKLTATRKKTDEMHTRIGKLEFEASLYWDDEMDCPVITSETIERCIVEGAQKSRLGKQFKAGVYCTEPVFRLNHKGPKTIEGLYKAGFYFRKLVRVQSSRMARTRPRFDEWSVDIELEYSPDLVNEEHIIKALSDAGKLVGIGDWRPKYGQFIVEKR